MMAILGTELPTVCQTKVYGMSSFIFSVENECLAYPKDENL